MQENQEVKSSSISREKLLLVLIPVIGSIIIALITNPNMKCSPEPKPFKTSNLKNKAGKVNDMVMFENYNDLYTQFSEYTRQTITRELFNSVNDSMKVVLGNFIKPIDTTQNNINGMDFYYVKNQHQKGQSLVTIAFDNKGNIIHLLYGQLSKQ